MTQPNNGASGKVYLVGAGPGDPELLTLKGHQCLQKADVVLYDALIHPSLLQKIPSHAVSICVGKRKNMPSLPQQKIHSLMIDSARQGKTVVRFKGGDPFLFARGAEEALALSEAKIPYEVIPGVTAALAVSAYSGFPLTHRDYASQITFITAHEDPEKSTSTLDWNLLAKSPGTLVIYMGVSKIQTILDTLLEKGKQPSTPAAIIEWGCTPRQKTYTAELNTLTDLLNGKDLSGPCLIIIGEVVRLRDKITGFESLPLFGKKVLITRSPSTAGKTVKLLQELGAETIEIPLIEIQPPLDFTDLDSAIQSISNYQWIVFTSSHGVESLMNRIKSLGLDIRALKGPKIAAVGSSTAKLLEELHLKVDLVPEHYQAKDLANELTLKQTIKNCRILIPQADIAQNNLANSLSNAGAIVDSVTAYRTLEKSLTDEEKLLLSDEKLDWVIFTSSSTVRYFFKSLRDKPLSTKIKLASLGPVTSGTLRSFGKEPTIESPVHTLSALIQSMVEYIQQE